MKSVKHSRPFSLGRFVFPYRPNDNCFCNLNFLLLSLNVRGIQSFDKKKTMFHWLVNEKSAMTFLQETYNTLGVENILEIGVERRYFL